MKPKSVLIIEDEHALGSALSLLVTRMGHRPQLVASAAAGLEALGSGAYDAAVIDIGLPDKSGLEVLDAVRKAGSSLPVLIVTAHATLEHALESQKQGATAYMNKPLDMEELKVQLEALLESGVSVDAPSPAEGEVDPVSLIGAAPCLRDVFIGIARASTGEFPVLIHGASGSGKSLAARLVHKHGKQAAGPLHEVDGASLEVWEVSDEWSGGSVVIENLSALDAGVQAALSEWIQSEQEQSARIIATIAMNPEEAVEQGLLREDLYFAFKPGSIRMPSLSERSSDIPALCHYFAGLSKGAGEAAEITPGAMTALQAHDWPGNVRELKHVLHYAMSMSQGGPIILSHLPESLTEGMAEASASGDLGTELEIAIQRWLDQEMAATEEVSYDELLQRLETQLLQHLMERFEHKPTRLAAAMSLHRGTLRQKLQRCGLQ